MTELTLFELMSEADCELLARSDVRVNVRSRIGLRVLAVAAAVSVLLVVSLFVGAFAVVHHYKEQHPEIQGGIVEVLSGVLADEDSPLYEILPENVKLELGDLIVKLGGDNPFVPLGPGEEQSTGATETEKETNSNNGVPWHKECDYCGKLDGENRWFIAVVIDSDTVKPIGENCFEAVSAGEACFILEYAGDNLIEEQGFAPGDIVRITYNGYVVVTYPGKIYPDSVEPVEGYETESETEPNDNGLWHNACEYCGKLDVGNRWFIARVVNSNSVKPIGDKCFEAIAAGDAEIDLLNLEKDQFTQMGLSEGDLVRITYDGYIMESYPVQIRVNSIEPIEP